MSVLDNARAAHLSLSRSMSEPISAEVKPLSVAIFDAHRALRDLIAEHEALTLIKHHGPVTDAEVETAARSIAADQEWNFDRAEIADIFRSIARAALEAARAVR